MTLRDALEGLPDEAQVPVGWVREKLAEERPEETPQDFDLLRRTLDMWGEIATRNLSPRTCPSNGDGPPAGRA